MKKIAITSVLSLLLFSGCGIDSSSSLTKEDVIGAMEKSARYHMKNMEVTNNGKFYDYTFLPVREWHAAPYYDGMIALAKVTGNPAYWNEVLQHGTSVGWTSNPPRRSQSVSFHADDHAVCHAWLDTYMADTSRKERLEPSKILFEDIIKQAKTFKPTKPAKWHGVYPKNTWTWCDALFMAPPTLARLYAITGDKQFLDYMNNEFKFCYDTLFSPEDNLFYRDSKYIGQKTESGNKIFWSRGNGWVVGGLVQMLEVLPKDEPCRKFYEELFVKMMKAIVEKQNKFGLWPVNLTDDAQIKGGETSGSGFFTYALAWGINNNLLDRKTYQPKAEKAWCGLLTRVKSNGMVGYVQPVGEAPTAFNAETKHAYGVGAFLLAGSEIAKMLNMQANVSDSELLKSAQKMFDIKTKKAFVHIEPRRKDDVAWENDKMAFRVYGPALENSIENSGVDVWAKRVPYSVIMSWYENDFAKKRSYHKDYGEGCDMYKVANSVGLGGTGLWHNGKLYQSNVYKRADVIWQSDRSVKLTLAYHYDVNGRKLTEIKTISLGVGDDACKVVSSFFDGHIYKAYNNSKPITDIEVAVGILTQSPNAKISVGEHEIFVDDKMEDKVAIQQFVKLDKPALKSINLPFAKTQQVLLITQPSKNGEVLYQFGFKLLKN